MDKVPSKGVGEIKLRNFIFPWFILFVLTPTVSADWTTEFYSCDTGSSLGSGYNITFDQAESNYSTCLNIPKNNIIINTTVNVTGFNSPAPVNQVIQFNETGDSYNESGSWNDFNLTNDTNYNTYGNTTTDSVWAYGYVNYSKPANTNRIIWETKSYWNDGFSTVKINTTLSSSCVSQGITQLRYGLFYDAAPTHTITRGWCWNGTEWDQIYNDYTDANNIARFYEESVYFIRDTYPTNIIIDTANDSLPLNEIYDDTEDASVLFNWNPGDPGSNTIDENHATYGAPANGNTSYTTEYYTNPGYPTITEINWSIKIEDSNANEWIEAYCHNGTDMQLLYNSSDTDPGTGITITNTLPTSCYSGENITTNVTAVSVGPSAPRYYEGWLNITYYGDYNFSGELNSTNSPQTADLNATSINNYLSSCIPDPSGYCLAPLNIFSDTAGILQLDSLNITNSSAENVSFIAPTPADNDNISVPYFYVNVSSSGNISGAWLNLTNSTGNHQLVMSSQYVNSTYSYAYINITQADQNGITYKAFLSGNSTEIRTVNIDTGPPEINILYPNSPRMVLSFGEGAGIYANDSSPYNNNGTLTGPPTWTTDTPSGSGYALLFDGSTDYVTVTDDISLDITDNMTVEAWIKRNESGVEEDIITKYGAILQRIWRLYITSNNETHFAWSNVGITPDTTASNGSYNANSRINDTNWHHILATEKSGYAEVYVDGVLAVSWTGASTSIKAGTPDVVIGYDFAGSGFYFNGTIDEPAIYSRVLPIEEIQYHYNRNLNGAAYRSLDHVRLFTSVTEPNFDTLLYWVEDSDGTVVISNTTFTRNTEYTIGPSLPGEGTYTIFVFANDSTGNSNITNESFTIDFEETITYEPPTPASGSGGNYEAEPGYPAFTFSTVTTAQAYEVLTIEINASLTGATISGYPRIYFQEDGSHWGTFDMVAKGNNIYYISIKTLPEGNFTYFVEITDTNGFDYYSKKNTLTVIQPVIDPASGSQSYPNSGLLITFVEPSPKSHTYVKSTGFTVMANAYNAETSITGYVLFLTPKGGYISNVTMDAVSLGNDSWEISAQVTPPAGHRSFVMKLYAIDANGNNGSSVPRELKVVVEVTPDVNVAEGLEYIGNTMGTTRGSPERSVRDTVFGVALIGLAVGPLMISGVGTAGAIPMLLTIVLMMVHGGDLPNSLGVLSLMALAVLTVNLILKLIPEKGEV